MIPSPVTEAETRAIPEDVARTDLHKLDYQEISISAEALSIVRAAGRALIERHMHGESARFTPARALAMFLDRIYFNQRTGELLLCADVPAPGICLPIPKGHWGLRRMGREQ